MKRLPCSDPFGFHSVHPRCHPTIHGPAVPSLIDNFHGQKISITSPPKDPLSVSAPIHQHHFLHLDKTHNRSLKLRCNLPSNGCKREAAPTCVQTSRESRVRTNSRVSRVQAWRYVRRRAGRSGRTRFEAPATPSLHRPQNYYNAQLRSDIWSYVLHFDDMPRIVVRAVIWWTRRMRARYANPGARFPWL